MPSEPSREQAPIHLPSWENEDGLVLCLLSYLDVSDVVRSKRVNKRWKCLCEKAIDDNFQPKYEFKDDWLKLRGIVKRYCSYKKHRIDWIGKTYGYPINKWKVGKVRDFSHVFSFQTNFNEDIGEWDMSNAKILKCMFFDCASFNQDLSKWDTSKVRYTLSMFDYTPSFTQDLSEWDKGRMEDWYDSGYHTVDRAWRRFWKGLFSECQK